MKLRSGLKLATTILLVVGGTVIGSTSATAITSEGSSATATSAVHPLYVKGTAHAYALSFTTSGEVGHYHCSFSNWAAVRVNWSCSIYDGNGNIVVTHTGHFTGPSFTTSTYSFNDPLTNCYYTYAFAEYNDGSASAGNQSACV